MALRWGVGLPGPFYVSGRVIPRMGSRRSRGGSGGWGAIAGFFVILFYIAVFELLICYWVIVALTGVGIWTYRSIKLRGIAGWPLGTWIWVPWTKRVRRSVGSASTAVDANAPAQETGKPVEDQWTLYNLHGSGDIEVVGESFHEQQLRQALQFHQDGQLETALLIPEPSNPHDSHAVRIDLVANGLRYAVGYLDRETAREYSSPLATLTARHQIGSVPAKIWMGNSGPQVYLRLDSPDRILGRTAPLPNGEVLDSEWSAVVTGEEAHQLVLASTAARGKGPLVTLFSLDFSTVDKGKYAGLRCIQVSLNDQPVGKLTRPISQRYEADIERLIDQGKIPFAEGVIAQDANGVYQVTLAMPAHR